MGNYDLYGNSYRTRLEAENAEMAQCAAIEASMAYEEMQNMKRQMQYQEPPKQDEEIHHLKEHVANLEERLSLLEEITKHLRPI